VADGGAPGVPFVRVLADFAAALRTAGLPVGTGDVLAYATAMSTLDPTDLTDLYWAGRTTLVTRRDSIAPYNQVFRQFFLNASSPVRDMLTLRAQLSTETQAVLDVPATDPPSGEEGEPEEATLGLMASDAEALRHKSFAACSPEELAMLRRIMTRIRLAPPRRRTRRTRSAPAGQRPDLRRMVRESLRLHGEPAELSWRRRKVRLRPLILILDVSGSMADYSRSLLQFAYSAQRAASQAGRGPRGTAGQRARVEVFCFGTRLTRITRALDRRRPDEALRRATEAVVDWEGGTRIGASLDTFVRDWGRRGLCRGAVVVICSDGLDRGDPDMLAAVMERLARLSHRIVWLNPHAGGPGGALGMMVAAPHIDLILPGHDLSSLEELATLLPAL
jgi:uncharacterized protein